MPYVGERSSKHLQPLFSLRMLIERSLLTHRVLTSRLCANRSSAQARSKLFTINTKSKSPSLKYRRPSTIARPATTIKKASEEIKERKRNPTRPLRLICAVSLGIVTSFSNNSFYTYLCVQSKDAILFEYNSFHLSFGGLVD